MDGTLRDVLLVARFELLRAMRTRRALAFSLLYLVAAVGAAYVFIQVVGGLENTVAAELGVPRTRTPGTLTHELVKKESFQRGMAEITASETVGELVQRVPLLAIVHLFFSLLALPFFAATLAAESIAADVASRALRFELLRTGRLELVLGRFLGQLALTGLACLVAAVGVQAAGAMWMHGFSHASLAVWLCAYSVRAWAYVVPFVGVGMAFSQLTDSPGWARAGAIVTTAGSWILCGVFVALRDTRWGLVSDVGFQLLPQAWLTLFWEPGWPVAALVCGVMGLCVTLLGAFRFLRRDL